jgi:hypothetical protein
MRGRKCQRSHVELHKNRPSTWCKFAPGSILYQAYRDSMVPGANLHQVEKSWDIVQLWPHQPSVQRLAQRVQRFLTVVSMYYSYVEIVEFWSLWSCHIVSRIVQNKLIGCDGDITFRAAIINHVGRFLRGSTTGGQGNRRQLFKHYGTIVHSIKCYANLIK